MGGADCGHANEFSRSLLSPACADLKVGATMLVAAWRRPVSLNPG